ncbi:hypothetical protein [Pseudoxanthomonas mexicana]
MPELQPKMRDALLAAIATPSRTLQRACGGYVALGTSTVRHSGPKLFQAFTRRTVNRLLDAGLVTFDEPEFPTRITLTEAGVRSAQQLVRGGERHGL